VKEARQSQAKYISSTQVLVDTTSLAVAGFYTLAMGQIPFGDLPPETLKKLPRRELPVAVLAWLGVDKGFQKKGLGQLLMASALQDCWHGGVIFPFIAVVVDAIDEETKAFYLKWGFREFAQKPLRLFLSVSQLQEMVAPASTTMNSPLDGVAIHR
jgi:GNAT superfamily N-acetyltransferase